MKIKRYFAKDMRSALTQVKEELGADAVIMSNKKTATGVEIVAAIDADAKATPAPDTGASAPQPNTSQHSASKAQTSSAQANNKSQQFSGPNAEGAAKIASSLEELLKRQRGESTTSNDQQDFAQSASPQTSSLSNALDKSDNFAHLSVNTNSRVPSNTPHQPSSVAQQSVEQAAYNQALTNQQKSDLATQALSQQAESEFEQWLNKARTTVEDHAPSTNVDSTYNQSSGLQQQVNTETSSVSSSNVVDGDFGQQMSDLKSEMNSIKELLKHQVSELMWQDVNRKAPVKAMLINKLKEMGLSNNVSEHLSHFVDDNVDSNAAWPQMLGTLTEQLSTTDNEIIKRGGVYSLVGPTGVGKTTTIAKLAARFAQIHGADKVGLITTDSFRIGALEQLATYAKILGCPLKQAKDTEQLSEAIYQLRDKKLLLIDTAGMSQRDIKLTERLNNLLTRSRVNIKNYLVLSATSQMSVLQESVQHFKTIPLSGCIFTKIDESLSLGELISVAIHNRLPIGYLTNGQRVPEDIRVANADKIVQKANQLYELKEKVSKKNNKVVPKAVGMYD